MKINRLINKVTEVEKLNNTRLLQSFSFAFSAHDSQNLLGMLHDDGAFFGKMNKSRAVGHFYTLFFGENGIQNKMHIDINRGFALGCLSGQEVLEFRWSDFDPFNDSQVLKKRFFGAEEDKSINERVIRLAFSFKDELIYSISIPHAFTGSLESMKCNN